MKSKIFFLLLFNSFILYNFKNEVYEFNPNQKYTFIIFFDGISCATCYKKLSETIRNHFEDALIIALAKYYNNIIERRRVITRAKEIFDFDTLLFDKNYSIEESLFIKYKIGRDNKSPSLLMILPDTTLYYSFYNLFMNNNLDTIFISLKSK